VPIIREHVNSASHIMTDEAGQYAHLNKYSPNTDFTKHSMGEYVKGIIHTNTVEGFYSVFKRGMKGIYQHCSEGQPSTATSLEFDFRYNPASGSGGRYRPWRPRVGRHRRQAA